MMDGSELGYGERLEYRNFVKFYLSCSIPLIFHPTLSKNICITGIIRYQPRIPDSQGLN